MASSLDALLHKVVASRVAQLRDKPLGELMPVIDDLVIPTDDRQSSDDNAVFVSFTNSVRHLILRDRLGLPEWLKAHRTGDQSVVAVLVAADYTLPLSWCWDPLPAGADESPVAQRIIMLTLRDGGGHVYLDRGQLQRTERNLPPSPTARWVHALYQCCCTYLSHTSPNTIIGADGPRWKRPPSAGPSGDR